MQVQPVHSGHKGTPSPTWTDKLTYTLHTLETLPSHILRIHGYVSHTRTSIMLQDRPVYSREDWQSLVYEDCITFQNKLVVSKLKPWFYLKYKHNW